MLGGVSNGAQSRTLRVFLGFAALVAAGCSQLEAGSVRFDPEPELETLTLAAADRIYEATGIEVAVGKGERDLQVPVRFVPPSARGGQREGAIWSGHFNGRELVVNEQTPKSDLGRVVLHEMLHAVMLSDAHPEGGSVLAEVGHDANAPLTAEDLEFVCASAPCAWMRPEQPANE